MTLDSRAQVAEQADTCHVCGVKLPPGPRIEDADGKFLCAACDAADVPFLADLDIEGGGPSDSDASESIAMPAAVSQSAASPAPDAPAVDVSPAALFDSAALAGSYQCSVCRRRFGPDQVYEAQGEITCVECWAKLHPPAQSTVPSAEPSSSAASAPAGPVTAPSRPAPPPKPALIARVTCPNCWQQFPVQDVLWISRHAELIGDPIAGPDAPLRFLPSRFTPDGAALDARGMTCHGLACPWCHIELPRAMIEADPLFASIVGVSASGKSYFLTAMTWELRRLLPLYFGISFNDADALANRALNHHEETLFLPADAQKPVRLDKTDTVGSLLYNQIRLGQQAISLPRPFLFTMRPSSKHPNADWAAHLTRIVCLYDNAGEHFSPGEDTASSPVTRHLGSSRVLMFLYDPTQDPRFRARCRGLSADPQLQESAPTRRQETVLQETAARVRQFAGLAATQPVQRPMLVVVPKADVWGKLVDLDLSTEPILPGTVARGTLAGVDMTRIEGVSAIIREMLLDTAPEFIASVEGFTSNVVYIPTSALGGSPQVVEGRDGLWIRPAEIHPRWVTTPFLYMFARWSHDVIGGVRGIVNGE